MYDILKAVISAGGDKLAQIQHKVKKLYVWGDLTQEQTEQLLSMSQEYASADGERPETLVVLQELSQRIAAIEQKLKEEADEVIQYPQWMPWDYVSDRYQPGAVVSHNGKLWRNIHTAQNTWEPGTVGTERLWVVYEEE